MVAPAVWLKQVGPAVRWSCGCRYCQQEWREQFATELEAFRFLEVHHVWCSPYRRLRATAEVGDGEEVRHAPEP